MEVTARVFIIFISILTFQFFDVVCFAQTPGSNKFDVEGIVFRDVDQNGFMDGIDFGISGVEIQFAGGTKVVTGQDGKFKHSFQSGRLSVRVSVNKETVPAGSVFTSPSEQYLSRQIGSARKVSFGVYYDEEEIDVLAKKSGPGGAFELKDQVQLRFEVRGDNLFLNGKEWRKVSTPKNGSSPQALPTDGKVPFRFSGTPAFVDRGDFDKILGQFKTRAGDVISVTITSHSSTEELEKARAEAISKDIRIALMEAGANPDQIFIQNEVGPGGSGVVRFGFRASQAEGNVGACILEIESQKEVLTKGARFQYVHDLKKESKGILACPGSQVTSFILPQVSIETDKKGFYIKTSRGTLSYQGNVVSGDGKNVLLVLPSEAKSKFFEWVIESQLESGIKFDIQTGHTPGLTEDQKTSRTVKVFQSRYLSQSRDLNVHLRVKSDFNTLLIEGNKTASREAHISFSGNRGKNEINFETFENGKTNKITHSFELFPQKRVDFGFNYHIYSKTSESDSFSSNYKLGSVQAFDVFGTYFFNYNWGVRALFGTDISPINITDFDGNALNPKHLNLFGHAVYRTFLKEREFHTPKFQFYFGVYYKAFDPGADAVVLYQVPTFGPHAAAEVIFEEFPIRIINMKSKLGAGMAANPTEGFFFRMDQTLSFSLNPFGAIFGFPSSYVFYDKYELFHDLRADVALYYEWSKYATSNSNAGETTDSFFGLTLGVSYSF